MYLKSIRKRGFFQRQLLVMLVLLLYSHSSMGIRAIYVYAPGFTGGSTIIHRWVHHQEVPGLSNTTTMTILTGSDGVGNDGGNIVGSTTYNGHSGLVLRSQFFQTSTCEYIRVDGIAGVIQINGHIDYTGDGIINYGDIFRGHINLA